MQATTARAKRSSWPDRVTRATVTFPDGTIKELEDLTPSEREALARHINRSVFEAIGLKVTFSDKPSQAAIC